MKLREVYLVNGQTLNDSDTVTIDLTRGLKILKLRIQYQATNGATSNTVGRLNGMVSKLSVIDGSDVKWSLSMREAQAKNFYDDGTMPYQSLSQVGAAVVVEEAVIDFRRNAADTQFYLDTSAYTNPQLQLTHALTISATAGFATGTGKLSVIATVIDSGAPARLGYVMAKEVDSFASATSGDHITDLPLDFPIAAIMVLDPVDANTPDHYLSNFKLTADTDAFIPINMSYADLLRENINRFGRADQQMVGVSGTSWTITGDLYNAGLADIVGGEAQISSFVSTPTGNQFTGTKPAFYPTGAAANTATTADTPLFELNGSAPHSSVIYRFGDGMSSDQIFAPQGVGKFQLKLTNANTGATPKVVVVQQRS